MPLRVGVLGPVYADSLEDNVLRSVARLGHEGVKAGSLGGGQTSKWGSRASSAGLKIPQVAARMQQRLVDHLPQDLDLLIVTTSTATQLFPWVVAELKRRVRRVVVWYVDAVSNLGPARFLDSPYDAVFLTDRMLVRQVRDGLRLPVHLLPEGHDPRQHRPVGIAGEQRTIVVVGNYRAERIALLRQLHRDGIPLTLYGRALPEWARSPELERLHTGKWVTGLDKSRVFHESAAVLNPLHPAVLDAVNCRVFEAAAAGAVVVAEWRPLLDELFANGSEVLAYRTYEELLILLRRCLDSPEDMNAIRLAVAARAARDHTLDQRVAQMIEMAGLAAG